MTKKSSMNKSKNVPIRNIEDKESKNGKEKTKSNTNFQRRTLPKEVIDPKTTET